MSFESEIAAWVVKVKQRERALFVGVATAVKDSIVNGSAVTGAPGQPVVSGTLKNSWQLEFESPSVAVISTNVVYARSIEENLRNAKIPRGKPKGSTVGGPHSLKLTRVGAGRLIDIEVQKVNP